MAHFAQLDENNVVLQVIVVHNNELLDQNNQEQESIGIAFCQSLFGQDIVWKQTSYNGNIRKNYAGIGYKYHADIDAFVPPQPYASWTLDANAQWQPPVAMPTDGTIENPYTWDEATTSWTRLPS